MKRGENYFLIILVLLVAVILFVTVAVVYKPNTTGDVVNEPTAYTCVDGTKVASAEYCSENIVEKLVISKEDILLAAQIGNAAKDTFDIINANDFSISVNCGISEQIEPSTIFCSTIDSTGNYVGPDKLIEISQAEKQTFTVSVSASEEVQQTKGDSKIILKTQPGEYNREIILKVWKSSRDPETAQELRIPLRVFIEE